VKGSFHTLPLFLWVVPSILAEWAHVILSLSGWWENFPGQGDNPPFPLDGGAKPCYDIVNLKKEGTTMPTEKEILMIQKATMFDLKQILEANPDKTYTVDELKALIDAYIAGLQ
jgi:hypothetical protein